MFGSLPDPPRYFCLGDMFLVQQCDSDTHCCILVKVSDLCISFGQWYNLDLWLQNTLVDDMLDSWETLESSLDSWSGLPFWFHTCAFKMWNNCSLWIAIPHFWEKNTPWEGGIGYFLALRIIVKRNERNPQRWSHWRRLGEIAWALCSYLQLPHLS